MFFVLTIGALPPDPKGDFTPFNPHWGFAPDPTYFFVCHTKK